MATGTVKFFNAQKGYGFIVQDAGGQNIFVHISAVERAGMRTLNQDKRFPSDIEADRRSQKRGDQSSSRVNSHYISEAGAHWRRLFLFETPRFSDPVRHASGNSAT